MTGQAKYLFLDLETTGLDPDADGILECAAIVTDANLREIGEPLHVVVRAYDGDRDDANEHVQAMHDKNGLWRECFASDLDVDDLAIELDALIESHEWSDPKGPILAGSSVHFDRSFLDADMPDVLDKMHYRMLDVRSLTLAAEDACGLVFPKHEAHRALPDVRETIERARRVFEALACRH